MQILVTLQEMKVFLVFWEHDIGKLRLGPFQYV